MTFTIKCDNCGNEQQFKDDSKWDKIRMIVVTSPEDWSGTNVDDIEIHCENPDCQNYISVDY